MEGDAPEGASLGGREASSPLCCPEPQAPNPFQNPDFSRPLSWSVVLCEPCEIQSPGLRKPGAALLPDRHRPHGVPSAQVGGGTSWSLATSANWVHRPLLDSPSRVHNSHGRCPSRQWRPALGRHPGCRAPLCSLAFHKSGELGGGAGQAGLRGAWTHLPGTAEPLLANTAVPGQRVPVPTLRQWRECVAWWQGPPPGNLATECHPLVNSDSSCPRPSSHLLPPINAIFCLTAGLLCVYIPSVTTAGHHEATYSSPGAMCLGSDRFGWAVPWGGGPCTPGQRWSQWDAGASGGDAERPGGKVAPSSPALMEQVLLLGEAQVPATAACHPKSPMNLPVYPCASSK